MGESMRRLTKEFVVDSSVDRRGRRERNHQLGLLRRRTREWFDHWLTPRGDVWPVSAPDGP
jgi:hypothetical protein